MFIKTWKIYLQCTLGTDFKKCAITSIRNLKMSATWDFQHRQWWLNLIVAAGWRKYNSQNASKWAKWDSQKSRLLCCDWERRPVGCAVQKHYRGFNKRRAWVFTTLALAPTCRVSRSPRRQQTLHKQRQLKAQRALITQRSCVCVRPSLLVLLHLLTRCHARLPLTPTPAGLENAPEVCLTYHGLRREAARAVFTLSAPAFFSFCFFFFLSLCLSVLEIRGGACGAAAAERGQPWWRAGKTRGEEVKKMQADVKEDWKIWNEPIRCNSTPARQEFIAHKQKLPIERKCSENNQLKALQFYLPKCLDNQPVRQFYHHSWTDINLNDWSKSWMFLYFGWCSMTWNGNKNGGVKEWIDRWLVCC